MPADEGIDFLLYAIEREEEALLYQRWIAGAQYSMSFDEFRHLLEPKPVKKDEDVLDDVAAIMKAWDAKRNLNKGGD